MILGGERAGLLALLLLLKLQEISGIYLPMIVLLFFPILIMIVLTCIFLALRRFLLLTLFFMFFCGVSLVFFGEEAATNLDNISDEVADKKGLSFIKDSLERSVFMKEYMKGDD